MNINSIIASVLALFLCAPALAQERATTESGRAVILNPDGTWRNAAEPASTSSGNRTGTRSPTATTKLELGRTGNALFYDLAHWSVTADSPGRTLLQLRGGDGYATVITERISVPMDNIVSLALQMAKQAAPDAKLISQSSRTVNGKLVVVARMSATLQGVPFAYLNHYYSGRTGTVQVMTYTSATLFRDYEQEFEQLLNGLVLND